MIYRRFFTEQFDAGGLLRSARLHHPPHFNFSYDVMDELARQVPDKLALLWCDDAGEERRFSFSEIQNLSQRAAAVFQAWGLQKGDVLMVALRCRYEYWIIALAAHRLGLLLCPVFHLLSGEDFSYRLETARPKAIISLAEGETAARLRDAAQRAGIDRLYAVGGKAEGFGDFDGALAAAAPLTERVDTRADEPILLYFTSGSTGPPKGVLHNHSFLLGTLLGARHLQGNGSESLHFAIGNSAWQVVCGTKFYGQWLCESAIFVYDYEHFSPETLLRQLAARGVTSVMAQPSVYQMLTEAGMDRCDLSRVTCFSVGGEALTKEISARVLAQTGRRLCEGYAQSEAGLITANAPSVGWKEGSVGRALPKYHVEVRREDGSFAGPNEPGELVLIKEEGETPVGLLMGYYGDPAATEALWDGDVFHSGDWVVRDEEGFFFCLGRMDGLIKSRAYRVSPFEIEDVLSRHPAVRECMVAGERDPDWGEKICAYVCLREGISPDAALEAELLRFHNEACATYKKIRSLRFVPSLRRNGNGKLMRSQFTQEG